MSASPAEALSQRGETAERILSAAADLFATRGYEAVSMNEIARHAAVSKANVFHHFNSKHDLYLTVVRRACTHSRERLAGLGSPQGSLAERFNTFVGGMLGDMLDQAQVTRIILREGQAQGTLRRDLDPAMVATLLIGANVFFFEARDVLRHFRDVSFADKPESYSRMLADILLKGILAAPDNTHRE